MPCQARKHTSAMQCGSGAARIDRREREPHHDVSGGRAGQRYADRKPSRIMMPFPHFGQRTGGCRVSAARSRRHWAVPGNSSVAG